MDVSTKRATGWINVTSYDSKPYDEALRPPISQVQVVEEFTGDIVGTGTACFLMVVSADGSAHFTGMERFTGKLGDRSGSFILRNSGTLKDGDLSSEWLVIPESGTGELSGLRGQGGCRTTEGIFLDYWFE
ncbi:MAG TPA: DUF3224 domain-containing protein [Terracidiphilus sp.]|nr:DUF3224 domain-containing protein [Terracidiphilus sp.]